MAADHDPECDQAIDPGNIIELDHKFPAKWLQAGSLSISDPLLHATLQSEYPEYYTVNHDEFTVGVFCMLKDGVYTTLTTQYNGATADYSTVPYKCRICKSTEGDIGEWSSGTRLKIGQSRAEAQALLGVVLKENLTTLRFQETVEEDTYKVWHSQSLRLEFREEALCRLTLFDFRER